MISLISSTVIKSCLNSTNSNFNTFELFDFISVISALTNVCILI